ncbi:tail fiber protein [Burkholderia phage vB_BglM_WTB]
MAQSILSSLLSQAAFKLVNQTTGAGAATGLKVAHVTIHMRSTVHRHQREDGLTLVDARTILATEVTVDGFASDLSALDGLNVALANRNDMFTLTTKGVVLSPMRVDGLSIVQRPDVLSAAPVRMSFKQALAPNDATRTFAQAADSSLVDRGIAFLTATKQSVTDLYSKVSSIF